MNSIRQKPAPAPTQTFTKISLACSVYLHNQIVCVQKPNEKNRTHYAITLFFFNHLAKLFPEIKTQAQNSRKCAKFIATFYDWSFISIIY